MRACCTPHRGIQLPKCARAGFTPATYTGNIGGRPAAHAACEARHRGSIVGPIGVLAEDTACGWERTVKNRQTMSEIPPLTFLFPITLGLVAGCGDGTDPSKEQQKETLDACGFPAPCESASLTYTLEPTSARVCILQELASGEPTHVSIKIIPDGGGVCSAQVEYYAPGDGTVLKWRRGDEDCSEDPDAVHYSYDLVRCTLKPTTFFNECLEKEGVDGEASSDDCQGAWTTDCAPAEPSCS